MANQNLGSIRGTIKIDYDGKGIVEATKDVDKAKDSTGGLDKAFSKVLSIFGKFGAVAGKVAGGALAISGSLHVVAGVLATIAPLAAAGLATLPAIIGIVGSISIVAKVAIAGMGDALKAASGSAKQFDKATKNMPVNAKQFAQAYRDSLPVLKRVQDSIQNTFFKGLGPQLKQTVSSVKQFQGGADGVAGAMRRVVVQVLEFARSPVFIHAVNAGLKNAKGILDTLAPAVKPLLSAFAGLASQGGGLGKIISGPLAKGLAGIAKFVSGINLKQVWADAAPFVSALTGTFKTLMGIIGPVFSALTGGGKNAAGILGDMATQLASFLGSAAGKQALDALSKAFEAISTGAGQVFLALLQALGPVLVALAPGITQLATTLAGDLVPAINTLAPILASVAGWVSDNVGWLGPLAAVIGTVALAYKGYVGALKTWEAIQGVAKTLKLADAAAWVTLRAQMVATKVQTIATAVVMRAQMLGTLIATTAQFVAQRIAMLAMIVIQNVIKVATIAWTAAQWLLNAALDANPIGLVIIAVIALIAGIILLWKNSATFRTIVLAVWSAIKTAIMATVNWVKNTAVPWLVAAWKTIWGGAKKMWSTVTGAFNAVQSVIRTVVSYIRSYISQKIHQILAIWDSIKQVNTKIRNAFEKAYSGAKSMLGKLISYVKGIPGKVVSALGNLGSKLYAKGKSLVQGFIDGIKSMIKKAENTAKSLVHSVTKWLPGSPAEVGPLSGKGYVLLRGQRFTQDLATGIQRMAHKPVAAMAGVVRPLSQAIPAGVSALGTGGTTAQRRRPTETFGPYHFMLPNGVLASFIIDTVTGQPKIVSNAADEGSRKKAWAGSGR